MYQQASHLRALLQRPEVYGALKILPEQARKLRALSHLPNRPNVVNGTMLYMIYRESPAGTARQDAADDLCDAVRSASQNHHAAAAEFVRAAGKILTGIQLDALPGVVDVPIQPGPISNENKKEGIRQ